MNDINKIKKMRHDSYIRNREKVLKYQKQYRYKNKEKIKKDQKEYRLKNKDLIYQKRKSYFLQYKKDNPKQVIESQKRYLEKNKNNPEFVIKRRYHNMNSRCVSDGVETYKNYKGRGIKNEWKSVDDFVRDMYDDFILFFNKNGCFPSLDRKNPNKNYSKNNCQWVSFFDNCSKNKRSNKIITYKGKTQILAEWSRELGIPNSTLTMRMRAYNWSIEKSLETPVRKKYDKK